MKKKNIFKSFFILGGATLLFTPIIPLLTSCSKQTKISNFFNAFNDPYKELNMFATTLQYQNNVNYGGDKNFNFIEKSEKINSAMKKLVSELSDYINNLSIFKNKDITVLFVKNDELRWDGSDESKNKINEFCIEQPILYSQIYSNTKNNDCPGFGMLFPTPINDDANSLFDDWFEIGASQMNSGGAYKWSISQRLTSAFSSTADIVFYLYDSNQIGNNESGFIDYVYNSTNNDFWPYQLLKNDAICKHVIPIDMQWMYYGLWDQCGSFIINYLFAQIFHNINENDGNIKPIFSNIKYFEKNINYKNIPIPQNEITNICKNSLWKPNNNLEFILPKIPNNNSNNKYLATLYNLVGHSISMGIIPNYIMKFNPDDSDKKYNELPGYLDWLKSDIWEKWGKNQNNFLDVNRLSNSTEVKNLNLFAISANRDIFKKNGIWPLPDISLMHDTTPPGIDDAINHIPNIKRIYSERNDTEYSWYGSSNFDMEIYDSKTNKITTINKFLNQLC